MGAYCKRACIRSHSAKPGEVLKVQRLFRYDEAGLVGDHDEIACIPHKGCWLEILATAETTHPEVNLLLPGEVLRHTRSFLFGDRLELPSGRKVGLVPFVGFKFQLMPEGSTFPPHETVALWHPQGARPAPIGPRA